ncbi:MAG: radical SAM protein [Proteobacteria bacterium]|nr:radical SAM protein [Pseudomonadota bacterium]
MGTQRQKIKNPTNKELKALEKFVVPYSNKTGDIRFHLTYPNNYWVAMSNLGFQAVYDILARDQRVIVERGFLPENSDEKEQQATKWRSFESDRLLGDCDILGFSLSFETDYSHLIRILNNQGLLFNSWQEREAAAQGKFSMPIIIAGGTAITLNPEPVADLIDALVIGEAEELLPEMIDVFHEAKTKGWSREQLLLGLAQIEGIYVPRFYEPHYNQDGTMLRFDARDDVPPRPRRRFVKDLSKFKTYSRILTSETEFKSMFLTETGRGCEMGCRFCVAGYIYRPIRKRSEEVLQETVQIGLENSDAIGFVGAAVSSHKSIAKLAQKVAESGARASLSSIMSQKVSKALAASISESEYKTVALAPEAGSTRLRRAAGKRVDNEQVINAARELAESGIRGFKLYFIVGLPTETDEDVDAIAALAITIRDTVFEISKTSGKLAWVSLSINPFIPKASTPFQWESMLDPKVLDKKIERIRKLVIKVPNLELRFEPPKESYFQGLLSRGDRRVVRLLLEVERRGENWKWLMKKTSAPILEGVPAVDFYVSRKIGFNELLPWEVVDSLIPRDLLEREAMRAYHGEGWTQPRAPEQPIIDGEDDIMRGVTL